MLNSMIANNLGSMASDFYDSLTISKAVFIIAGKEDGAEPKQCPVMINPSTISVDTRNRLRKAKGTGSTGGESHVVEGDDGNKQSVVSDTTNTIETRVSMELTYDLVLQYELVKSRNGTGAGLMSGVVEYKSSSSPYSSLRESLVGGINASVDKYSKVHLFNRDDFSYLDMEEACQQQKPVIFIWGPMKFKGYIESFNSTFTYFSSAGAPLRVKVKLTMLCAQTTSEQFQDNNMVLNLIKSFEAKAEEDGEGGPRGLLAGI